MKNEEVKYPALERYTFLHKGLGLFNWSEARLSEGNDKPFEEKLQNLEGKLPQDLLDVWKESVRAREKLNKKLLKYEIRGLF